ncbi:SMI1/KNR4 family protein [Streptomyces sp. NPDC005151]
MFVDAYGTVLINNQLTAFHPATRWFDLGERIREEPELWAEIPEELLPPYPFGTGLGELFPWAHSASSEKAYFWVPRDDADRWVIGVIERDECLYDEYEMTFNAWMLSYLRGRRWRSVPRTSRRTAPSSRSFRSPDHLRAMKQPRPASSPGGPRCVNSRSSFGVSVACQLQSCTSAG